MSLDRVVYWTTSERPTREQVQHVCEDFLGGVGRVEWHRETGRFYLDLPGACSSPLRRAAPDIARPFDEGQRRWIEVFVHDNAIDVMTRHHDDFTNALADRLVRVFARGWAGSYE